MAVNIFEDIVRTSLQAQGYFVMDNVTFGLNQNNKMDEKYRTSPSDIDMLAVKPRSPKERVLVVSCKGREMDAGKAAEAVLNGGKLWERDAWRHFRELAVDEWATALKHRVRQLTGSVELQHVTVVTKILGDHTSWRENAQFKHRMGGQPLKLWSLAHVVSKLENPDNLPHQSSAATQLIQLFKAG